MVPGHGRVTLDDLNAVTAHGLIGLVGIQYTALATGRVASRLEVGAHHLAPNGFLHAATVVALADSTCGAGTIASLDDPAASFTTIELKCNFTGTARDGVVCCEAVARHLGRTTQVWDATVTAEGGERAIALFRCTQMVLPGRR